MFTDATVQFHKEGTGLGAIVLDPDGALKGTLEVKNEITYSPLAAEFHAIIQGIRLLQKMQIRGACVYSDAVNAINMIKGEQMITSDVYHCVAQIQNMEIYFNSLSFV